MKLADWRRRKNLTQQQLADELGCIVTTIARYETGLRCPDRASMIRIYELTEGAVQPNDFYDLPPLRAFAPSRPSREINPERQAA